MKRDWEKIASDYIANGLTLEELSQRYNIALKTMKTHCASEGWVEKRRNFAAKTALRARAKASEQKARRQAEQLDKLEKMTGNLVEQLEAALDDPKQLFWSLVGDGPGKQKVKEIPKLDTGSARDFVVCLTGINELLQTLGGGMTRKDREQIKLSKERLKLEKEKFRAGIEAQGGGGADPLQIEIVEPKPLEDMVNGLTDAEKEKLRELLGESR